MMKDRGADLTLLKNALGRVVYEQEFFYDNYVANGLLFNLDTQVLESESSLVEPYSKQIASFLEVEAVKYVQDFESGLKSCKALLLGNLESLEVEKARTFLLRCYNTKKSIILELEGLLADYNITSSLSDDIIKAGIPKTQDLVNLKLKDYILAGLYCNSIVRY
ncbi:MAG: hypothetical protein AAB443_01695 [Patescibacteria group bacterium]